MNSLPSNFDSLSAMDKRAAVVSASGMTWEQWSALPGEQKTAMLLLLKGHTYQSGTAEMLGAARTDATAARIAGYFSGLGSGVKLALLAGTVAAVWLLWPAVASVPGKVRKAVTA